MAKSASRPAILPGSSAPFSQATRQAEPERWDTPFSKEMTEADVNLVLAHPLFITTRPERFPPPDENDTDAPIRRDFLAAQQSARAAKT